MSTNNPYKQYENNSVNTASPGELTLMLYNGCLKFIRKAKEAIKEKNYEQKNVNIQKAQKIIRELMVTLNMDIDISKEMMTLYDYLNRRLIDANLKNDIEILNEVEGFVEEFRDTWKLVIQKNRQTQYAGSGGQV
ncbi:flagellar export chaperone FliS [Bacillus sp. FJAT-52991]|uniref:Flagellar secretion chaperone FliS n=1 Tax=Bacillus kandeliae TaxID=3129297 RepID=A0ABZ2N4U7_9BACI